MKLKVTIKKLELSYEEYEAEKLCHKCGECWPATDEFFSRDSGTGNLKSPCKACQMDQWHAHNATAPCSVEGCNEPRRRTKNGTANYTRCDKHMQAYWQARYAVRKVTNAVKPCSVEGCDQPRKRSRKGEAVFARCEEHQLAYWRMRKAVTT